MKSINHLLTTKRGILFSFLVLAFTLLAAVNTPSAVAANEGFNPGQIIDDATFTHSGSMTVDQIQTFLNSKATCDTWGTKPSEFGGGTRAQWGTNRGTPPPYTCLRDYSENGKSSAQIIYDASQEFTINPQVLIVLLQKEQGLVTDEWPLPVQYRTATGYACPDTAPCDSQYFGLTNQLRWAARMFRAIMNATPTWYTPYILGNNYIQYNPDKNCGGTTVNITNRSTQALYNYTPYQPNPATVNAPMGTTVSCGAYGNINFFRYMSSWFGSMLTATSNVHIADGVYSIENVNSGRLLNVAGANPSLGTKIQIYDNDGTASSWWSIIKDSDGYYSLRNVATGNYADVTGANFRRGTTIQSWSDNGTCSQKWAAVYQNGKYKFLSKCSGLALDVSNGGTANGTGLQLWSNNSTPAQEWNLFAHKPQPVTDGFYSIISGSGMAVDVVNAQTSNGTGTQIYQQNNSPAQIWQFVGQSDGTYTIRNPISNRYLYVAGNTITAGSSVQIKDLDRSCAIKWNITGSSAGMSLTSICSNMALDITGGAVTTAGTPLQVWLANNTGSQQWKLSPVANNEIPLGVYSIRSLSGLAIDVTGGNLSPGTKTQLWGQNSTVPQQWQLVKQQDGTYTITNPTSGLKLDLTGGNLNQGVRTQVWTANNTCAQGWNVTKNSNGTYSFTSACTGLSLDISGGRIWSPGAEIQTWQSNGTASQQWLFGHP